MSKKVADAEGAALDAQALIVEGVVEDSGADLRRLQEAAEHATAAVTRIREKLAKQQAHLQSTELCLVEAIADAAQTREALDAYQPPDEPTP